MENGVDFVVKIGNDIIGYSTSVNLPQIERESEAWKQVISKTKIRTWKASFNSLLDTEIQYNATYYLKRGNRYYFKIGIYKLMLEVSDPVNEFN